MKRNMKLLGITTFIVVIIMLIYWITYDIPELFIGGAILYDIFYRLCEAYLISVVFFIIVEFIPYMRKKKLAEPNFLALFTRFVFNTSMMIEYLHRGYYSSIDIQKTGILLDSTQFIFEKEEDEDIFTKTGVFSLLIGANISIFQDLTHIQAIRLMKDVVVTNGSEILAYEEFLDERISYLVRGIIQGSIMSSIEVSQNDGMLIKMLKVRKSEAKNMFQFYSELFNLTKETGLIHKAYYGGQE